MKTFEIYDQIECRKVSFKNRFGITVAGDMYLPVGCEDKKSAAIAVSGPFGGVKEQCSGLYAQEFASRGFVAIAFDQSFCGESGGEVRNVASPEIFTEDFSAAVDFLGIQPFVDREKIGVMAICGLSGMALTAASSDTRIKAVAAASMYDMSRSISKGYRDSYTKAQRQQIRDFLSQQRWHDAESGSYEIGPHEIGIAEDGSLVTNTRGLSSIPKEALDFLDPVTKSFYDYYEVRAYHLNSINSASCWTQTSPLSFFDFDLMQYIDEISPRPVMLVAGENAHSRYYSEDVYTKLNDPKELIIVPGADHCDLYDKKELIPFDKLETFFKENLK